MDILLQIKEYVDEFNRENESSFDIDTIRVDFNKTYTLSKLKDFGEWEQLGANSNILKKLKRKGGNNITKAYQLKGYKIYYYGLNDKPKYRKARLIIYGMKQYYKDMQVIQRPSKDRSILSLVTNSATEKQGAVNVDICKDIHTPPNITNIQNSFTVNRYREPKSGRLTDTYYIDTPDIMGMERVTIYDKATKNTLQGTLWRIEATMRIHSLRALFMPLEDFKRDIIQPIERSYYERY